MHAHWQRRFNVFSIYIDVRKSRYTNPAAYEVSNTYTIFRTGWPNHERSSSAMMIHLVFSQIRSLRCFSDCPSKLLQRPVRFTLYRRGFLCTIIVQFELKLYGFQSSKVPQMLLYLCWSRSSQPLHIKLKRSQHTELHPVIPTLASAATKIIAA